MGQSISIGSFLPLQVLLPLRFRLWLGRKYFGQLDTYVVRVSWHRVIKGPCDPCEVEAMQYVAKHTTIPVPKLYAVHVTREKHIYIEMAYIRGVPLDAAWGRGRLTPDQKKTIFADIKEYVSALRALPPPAEDVVGSALQNPLYDTRVGDRFFGPFGVDDFHSLLRLNMPMDLVPRVLGEEVAKVHTRSYRTCFTHGDLVGKNIIVRDGRVAAIIDWGFSGWYPEYWEFTKAHFSQHLGAEWSEHIRQALPGYEAELEVEYHLWESFTDPGTPAQFYRGKVLTSQTPGSGPSAGWLEARAGHQPKDLWSIALASNRYTSVRYCYRPASVDSPSPAAAESPGTAEAT